MAEDRLTIVLAAGAMIAMTAPPLAAQAVPSTAAAKPAIKASGAQSKPAPQAVDPRKVSLDRIKIRLWYEVAGRLSDDIAPPRQVSLFNTVLGGGGAGGRASDALMTVTLRTPADEVHITQPLTMTAVNEQGKVMARRTFAFYLASNEGSVMPLWVRDVGCAGKVTFTAQVGAIVRRAVLDFVCGE